VRTLKLQPRPDLGGGVLSIFGERFPHLTREEIMVIAGIPAKELRHTRAAQERIAADPYARPGPAWVIDPRHLLLLLKDIPIPLP
jgi:hypothetical protein